LFAGTPLDNVNDALQKGRFPSNGSRKLSAEDVRMIKLSKQSSTDLAMHYGVDLMVISRARRGLTYKDMP